MRCLNLLDSVEKENIKFKSVVCPGAELQDTGLDVEREVNDVDGTGGLEDSRRHPENTTVR